MAENDIRKIIARIQADAKGKIDAIAEKKRAEIEAIARETARSIEMRKDKLTDEYNQETTRIGKRMHSAARLEAKRILLQAREEVIDRIFGKVGDMLIEMPENEYRMFLQAALRSAGEELGSDLRIHCRPEDGAAVKALADPGMRIEIIELERDTIGGILIESRSTGAVMNFLFENIIRRERSLIREEIGSVLYPAGIDAAVDTNEGN